MKSLVMLLPAMMLTAAATVTQAQAVKEKDWSIEKKVSETTGLLSCVASTASADSKVPVKLELDFPASNANAEMVLLKTKGLKGLVKKAYLRPDSKTAYAMPLLKSDAVTGEDVFVLNPIRIQDAVYLIGEKRVLDIYLGEGKKAPLARVSLKGSAVTLNRAASCRDSGKLLNEALMTEIRKDLTSVSPQPGTVDEMLAAVQQIIVRLEARNAKMAELVNHRTAGQALLAQERAAVADLTAKAQAEQATLAEITRLTNRLTNLQSELAKAQADLPGLEAQRPALVEAVAAAERAIAPHRPRVQELTREVNRAESELSSAQAVYNNAANRVTQAESDLNQLHSRVAQLQREQDEKLRQISQLDREIEELDRRHRNWNEHQEVREILRADSSYQRELDRLEKWSRIRETLPREIEVARSRVVELDRALRQCQAGPMMHIASTAREEAERLAATTGAGEENGVEGDLEERERERARREGRTGGNGEGRRPRDPNDPDRPREPGQPGEPNPRPRPIPHPRPGPQPDPNPSPEPNPNPTPDPNKCRDLEVALANAQRHLNQKEADYRESESKIIEIQRDLARMEERAREEARRRREHLVYEREQARREQHTLRDDVRELERVEQNIRFTHIPNAERELSQARNDLSSARVVLSNAERRLSEAQSNLESFKRSVGYDQLSRNLRQANNALESLDSAIAQARDIIANHPGRISATRDRIAGHEATLVSQRAARQAAEVTLQSIRDALVAHREQEAVLVSELQAAEAAVVNARKLAQGLAKGLG